MSARTLEQRIKFDHGLPVGHSLVRFTLGERSRIAVVEISENGRVFYLVKPGEGDMYSQWKRVRGDVTREGEGAVVVWGSRSVDLIRMFDGEPVAEIPVFAQVEAAP